LTSLGNICCRPQKHVLHALCYCVYWCSLVYVGPTQKENEIGVTGLDEKSCEWFGCWNMRIKTDRQQTQTPRLCSPFRKKKSFHCTDVRLLILPEPSERDEMEVRETTARYRHLAARIWNSYVKSNLYESCNSPIYMDLDSQNSYPYQYRCENRLSVTYLWRNEIRLSCGLTLISHFWGYFISLIRNTWNFENAQINHV
jgi:hypothetical protein